MDRPIFSPVNPVHRFEVEIAQPCMVLIFAPLRLCVSFSVLGLCDLSVLCESNWTTRSLDVTLVHPPARPVQNSFFSGVKKASVSG
jgi:hypothetical protein